MFTSCAVATHTSSCVLIQSAGVVQRINDATAGDKMCIFVFGVDCPFNTDAMFVR